MIVQSSYLRNQRQFPNDNLKELSNQMDHAYIDIASKVNVRIIGTFPVNVQAVTGETWYLSGDKTKQQTLRRVYTFTTTAPITHGIDFSTITSIPRGFGDYTNGTNYFGLIYGSNTAIIGQVSFYVTPTQIVLLSGAGAPAITSGLVILEWLSQP